MKSNQSPVITALDFKRADDALALVQQLSPSLTRVKVGKELFTRAGPQFVERLQTLGFDVFLDLKFHDIPNTVAGALQAAAELGVWMVNVHASGGRAMLEAAREAIDPAGSTQLIAVTVLTSMDTEDLRQVGVESSTQDQVKRLAQLVADCALDGVVCSPRESAMLRHAHGLDFSLVTPGVRPALALGAKVEEATSDASDQKRTMTPQDAINAGSDYLVIGRPITQSADPIKTLEQLVQSLTDAAGGNS